MNEKLAPFLPAAVLLVGVMFISGIREQYVMKPVQPMTAIPTMYEGMPGKDLAISADEQKIAGMSQFMFREFRKDSLSAFSVYVGYYDRQVQGKTIHSPKNCLPGAGWEIMENDAVPLAAGAAKAGEPLVNRVVLSNKGARALVYYWYQGRGRIENNEYRVKWDLLRDAALHGRTEEALVRLVIFLPPVRPDAKGPDAAVAEADALAHRVAVPLSESVYQVLPPFRAS